MAGGNGKKGDVIVLHPGKMLDEKTMLDAMNDLYSPKDERPRKFMGTLEEDPHITTLFMQYKAYMDRREIRLKHAHYYPGHLSFEDYLQIRGEL